MTTNQTQIFSILAEDDAAPLTSDINTFITGKIADGCINFDVKPITTQTRYDGAGTPQKVIYYVAQINYYDPAIMG